MSEGCDSYLPGDLVTLRGVAGMLPPKPMVIKARMQAPRGYPSSYVAYEVRLLEDDRSDYRKGHTMTVLVSDTDIVEGRCRSPDTKKWVLSPERATARAIRMGTAGLPPPAPPAPAVLAPSEFSRFANIVDGLLGELPEKRVEEFAKTPDMALYTKVIKNGYTEEEKRRFVEVVDTLLGELPEKTVMEFLKTPEYKIYDRVVKAAKK
jgi:hypothetical protein